MTHPPTVGRTTPALVCTRALRRCGLRHSRENNKQIRLTLVRPPTTLVDACVILDLTTNDPKWADWSEEAIARAADEGPLVINPIVYAEVSVDFTSIEELDGALEDADLRREPLPFDAGFLAGKAYLTYRHRGGARRSPLSRSLMADFYIGAQAAVAGHRLLTGTPPGTRPTSRPSPSSAQTVDPHRSRCTHQTPPVGYLKDT
jgi:predicted nucleic acid-binding protein